MALGLHRLLQESLPCCHLGVQLQHAVPIDVGKVWVLPVVEEHCNDWVDVSPLLGRHEILKRILLVNP